MTASVPLRRACILSKTRRVIECAVMNFAAEWWHWVVLGCALLAADALLINIYYLIWFGAGAALVGLALLLFPDAPFALQIVLWGAVSALLLLQWIFWLRPRYEGKRASEAKKQLPGQAGVVVRFNDGAGVLRLQRPVGGRDVWDFSSGKSRKPGERVVIGAVSGDGKAIADDTKEE